MSNDIIQHEEDVRHAIEQRDTGPLVDTKNTKDSPNDPASLANHSSRPVRFKIRIVDLDYYMTEPGPLDLDMCQFLPPSCPVLKVPVVRVYGANESGQKTCLHIHRAYPYFYVPYDGSLETSQLQTYILQLGLSLNHAANITFNTPQDPRKSQYVAAITPVKGIPFYGYHVGYSYFLKIYLFNPDSESRIVDLMRSGAIMGTQFQPFEAHIPFKLQFFIDFNLYGMGWLELEEGLVRNNVPEPMDGDHPKRLTKATVADTHVWSIENDPGRQSNCEIEMDSTVDRIVNRDRVTERDTHTTLEECFKPPSLTAQVPSMASLWEDDARRRKANNMPSQEAPKTQIRDPVSIPWLNHDANKHTVAELVRQMISQSQIKMPTQGDFANFSVLEDPLGKGFPTAYQSALFLCPRAAPEVDESGSDARSQGLQDTSFVYDEADSSILVDESIISQAVAAFDEGNIDTKKEIFKGLTGFRDIEEQDEDEDFALPDMNEFQDENFLDEADLWASTNSSDTEQQAIVFELKRPKTTRIIPQFDGSNDVDDQHNNNGERKDTMKEWQSITRLNTKKRDRSLFTASKDKFNAKAKRFREIATASEGDLAHQSPRDSRRPAVRDNNDQSVRFDDSHMPAPLESIRERAGSLSPRKRTRSYMQSVQIPSCSRRKSGTGQTKSILNRATSVTLAQPASKLVTAVSDSPDIEEDGNLDKGNGSMSQELVTISTRRGIPELERVRYQNPSTSKILYSYPAPASPNREYFMSAMDEMWSSPSPPLERPSFIHSPPRPTSPYLTSTHNISIPATQPYYDQDVSQQAETTVSSKRLSSPGPPPPEHESNDGSKVDQTFLDDPYVAQGNPEDTTRNESKDVLEIGRAKSGVILVEDSFLEEAQDLNSDKPETDSDTKYILNDIMPNKPQAFQFALSPPTTSELLASLAGLDLPMVIHQKPFYSNESDIPPKAKVFGGKEFRLQSNSIKTIPVFKSSDDSIMDPMLDKGFQFWEPCRQPPSRNDIQIWLEEEGKHARLMMRSAADTSTQKRREQISQIEGPTQRNPFGYKNSPTKIASSVAVEKDYLDVFSMELHCQTRGTLLPDPALDPIQAVFYCWQTDQQGLVSNGWVPGYRVGIFTHVGAGMIKKLSVGRIGFDIHMAENEGEMMNAVLKHILSLDPDILAGYEVYKLSWGYFMDRYWTLFGIDMSKLLSRIRPPKPPFISKEAMEARGSYDPKLHSGLKIGGRHLFNVWRMIRGEVALTNYGFCNVVFHVLQQRWWADGIALHQSRVVRYYLHRVQYNLQLIESQELISRTSEFARVFGVDFFSVISRGSQYKVESMMVRLAKPENFIMITPSRAQVSAQRALEVIPMVMEPESGFYEDPVVVLDFQSLYPSVMIAYNICYSTSLGKLGGGSKLGVLTDYNIPEGMLPLMKEHLHIAPNNVMYVNQDIRRGLLGRMLAEILDTRVMIKKAMKEYPTNKSLLKLLDARQLSLKFIANVTYGYTAASYSGRMPGAEIADSVVLCGRETLERSIRFVNDNPKWNARVVYGDTDSMFVHLKGRTRQEAFEIGYDIAETITKMNPRPVKLKFEKVYHGCFLVTKKRYVGNAYETPDQEKGIFDAKGIETIRRDGIPAVQKIMETCIKEMFRTKDLSLVKSYLVRQMGKILEGRVPVPDLMFGKEVRMGSYSEKGVPPPGAIISARRMNLDPRAEPQYGERIPYVVVYGSPGARLTDQVVEPKELLRNKNLRLNGEYYIRKHVIPSMERIFQLAGADVKSWFDEMPRVQRVIPQLVSGQEPGQKAVQTLSSINGETGSPAKLSELNSAVSVIPMKMNSAVVAAQEELKHHHHHQQQQSLMQQTNAPSEEHKSLPTLEDVATAGTETFEGILETTLEASRLKSGRKGSKGYVLLGSRIDRYYQSQLCTVCVLQNGLAKAEKLLRAAVDVCSSCCRGASNGGVGVDIGECGDGLASTGMELVACESLECTVFWQRQKAHDSLLVTRKLTEKIMKVLEELET
ncbi:DNA polymerase zeta [Lobosporangium transversale]|nr:DNA polymerase zeta [Lobosporangium transversale]